MCAVISNEKKYSHKNVFPVYCETHQLTWPPRTLAAKQGRRRVRGAVLNEINFNILISGCKARQKYCLPPGMQC